MSNADALGAEHERDVIAKSDVYHYYYYYYNERGDEKARRANFSTKRLAHPSVGG